MKPSVRIACLVAVASLAASAAGADVVFPARLGIAETAPGRYHVSFTLPMVEGRVLRASPVLPPSCRDLTERERAATAGGLTTTWEVLCEPASLAGEAILVEGLLGTQIEIAFSLETLDGRVFTEILKPSRPGFLVPPPPSPWDLATGGGLVGLRWVLGQTVLWLLALVVGLAGARRRDLGWGVAAFAVGAAAAQLLLDRGWLVMSRTVAESFVLLTVVGPAVALAGGGERWRGWIRPLWPAGLLTGVVLAGAGGAAAPIEGLSRGEQSAALVLFAAGAAVAFGWLLLIAVELRAVLVGVPADGRRAAAVRLVAHGLGALATGMLLARLVGLTLLVGELPPRAFSLVVAAAALAPFLAAAGVAGRWSTPAVAALAAVGLVPGLARMSLPLAELVVPALLLVVGLSLALARPLPRGWAVAIAGLSIVTASWTASLALVDSVSRSTGLAVAGVLVATAVFFAAVTVCRQVRLDSATVAARTAGLAVVLLVGVDRAAAALVWFEREAATAAALGLLRLPLLALGLVGLAVLLWPRRRRVLGELGIERRRPIWHWAALAAALIAVPYGTIAVRNPFHEPRAPRGDDARRVVSSVLFDTYRAFNLSDEEEVFDRLAESVTGDLVEDLYLDSRRRLNAGTREGTEVTVREVAVVEIGEPTQRAAGTDAVAYDCRWVVTSRVRHLQHIHHRQNIYGGVLTLIVDGDRWKIADVDLTSEDRVVIPGRTM
jgi:hydrogenase/urease accessory protein HupE